MIKKKLVILVLCATTAYPFPNINLGLTNILDGGPERAFPGFYWGQITPYSHAFKLYDGLGQQILNAPKVDTFATIPQFLYQFGQHSIKNGLLGFETALPIILLSRVEPNDLGIKTSGKGLGDLLVGMYYQSFAYMYKERPLFVWRLDFQASFPIGKVQLPEFIINPGNGFIFINPYFAGTLYFTTRWALSWRFFYHWSDVDKHTGIQVGQGIHFNYSTEFKIKTGLWIAIVGYYLNQLENDTLNGVEIPDSRERIFGIGPGVLYSPKPGLNLYAYLYSESHARSRFQAVRFVFRLLWHFG